MIELPAHIKEGAVIRNFIGHELHVVSIETSRVIIRVLGSFELSFAELWPFTVGEYTYVRKATHLEVAHANQLLRRLSETTEAS